MSFLTTSLTIDFTIFSSPLEHKNTLWRVAMFILWFLNIPNRKIFRVLTLTILENHFKKKSENWKKKLCSNQWTLLQSQTNHSSTCSSNFSQFLSEISDFSWKFSEFLLLRIVLIMNFRFCTPLTQKSASFSFCCVFLWVSRIFLA